MYQLKNGRRKALCQLIAHRWGGCLIDLKLFCRRQEVMILSDEQGKLERIWIELKCKKYRVKDI